MSGEYYILDASWCSNASEYTILNESKLIEGRSPRSSPIFAAIPWHPGFWPMSEKPVLQIKEKPRKMPKDIDYCGGYWLVSEKCKTFFEDIDPLAFEFVECDCLDVNGIPIKPRWFCDVIRVVDALDEQKTKVTIKAPEGWHKSYEIEVTSNLYFRKSVIPDNCHIFKMAFYEETCIIDRPFRDRLKSVHITNSRVTDVSSRGRLYGIR